MLPEEKKSPASSGESDDNFIQRKKCIRIEHSDSEEVPVSPSLLPAYGGVNPAYGDGGAKGKRGGEGVHRRYTFDGVEHESRQ